MAKCKVLAGLLLLSILDAVVPLPLLGLLLPYVIFNRPAWFWRVVTDIYRDGSEPGDEDRTVRADLIRSNACPA